MKVYMVSRGEYSDFSYIAAFSTEEKAYEYIAIRNRVHKYTVNDYIEEYEVDSILTEKKSDLNMYRVLLATDKTVVEETTEVERCNQGWTDLYGIQLTTFCYARDPEHAIKIASDRKAMMQAEGLNSHNFGEGHENSY